jgi:hypothetical protein
MATAHMDRQIISTQVTTHHRSRSDGSNSERARGATPTPRQWPVGQKPPIYHHARSSLLGRAAAHYRIALSLTCRFCPSSDVAKISSISGRAVLAAIDSLWETRRGADLSATCDPGCAGSRRIIRGGDGIGSDPDRMMRWTS